jgi:transposase
LRAGYHHQVPNLTTRARVRAALTLIAEDDSVRAVLCRRRLERILAIDAETAELKRQIAELVAAADTTLTDLYGIGPLAAARFIAEVVDVRRYPNRNAFAAANGTTPLPASSGRTVRHRFNPGGNRQLNRALYTIAITQIRGDTEGLAYYEPSRRQNQTRSPALPQAAAVRHRVHHHAPRRRSRLSLTQTADTADRDWGGCGRRKRGTSDCLTASCVAELPASTPCSSLRRSTTPTSKQRTPRRTPSGCRA